MNLKSTKKTPHTYQKVLVLLLIAIMIVFQFVDFHLFENVVEKTIVTNSIIRFIGGTIVMIILISTGYSWLFKSKQLGKSLLIIIPALIISINNFPIIAYLDGRAILTEPIYRAFLYFIECLSIGFFEEIIFRGILLVFLIKYFEHVKHGVLLSIVLSSLLFGFVHVFNLFAGASVGDTLLQIGYSFLVGMMWAVMFLRTRNLWLTMILHATFNFFGTVMFYLGDVSGRYDIYTIMITILLAVFVAVYSIKLFKQCPIRPLMH